MSAIVLGRVFVNGGMPVTGSTKLRIADHLALSVFHSRGIRWVELVAHVPCGDVGQHRLPESQCTSATLRIPKSLVRDDGFHADACVQLDEPHVHVWGDISVRCVRR